MAQIVSLAAKPRTSTGKGGARQARFQGKVPAVIYGHGRDTQPLELEAKALEKALQGVEPASTIIELAVDGKAVKTLIREIQRHPLRPDIIHVDFYEIHAEAELTIATVVPPRAEEVAAPTPEATTEVAEPELIRKVREGEEEGEEGAAAEGAPAKPEAKGGAAAAPAKGEKSEKAEKPKGGKES